MRFDKDYETDLISVIVPVYKVEDYLDQCVESLVTQTYKNLEIILVDDGSPDKCPQMCDEWAMRDERIRVIHKRNGGLSDARNAGVAEAKGNYIGFVDSDDWVHVRFLESLFNAAHTTGSDLAACGVVLVPDGECVKEKNEIDYLVDINTPEEALGTLIQGEKYRAVVWNKLYRRELLKYEEFERGKLHEDEFFTYRIIDKCRKLAYVNEVLYYYRQRNGSIMTSFSVRHLDALEAGFNRLCFLKERYTSLFERDKITFCVACMNYYLDAYTGKFPERNKTLDTIKGYRRSVRFSLSEWMKLSVKSKIRIIASSPCVIDIYANLCSRRAKNGKFLETSEKKI